MNPPGFKELCNYFVCCINKDMGFNNNFIFMTTQLLFPGRCLSNDLYLKLCSYFSVLNMYIRHTGTYRRENKIFRWVANQIRARRSSAADFLDTTDSISDLWELQRCLAWPEVCLKREGIHHYPQSLCLVDPGDHVCQLKSNGSAAHISWNKTDSPLQSGVSVICFSQSSNTSLNVYKPPTKSIRSFL